MATIDYKPTPAALSDMTNADVPFWRGRVGREEVIRCRCSGASFGETPASRPALRALDRTVIRGAQIADSERS